jgi:hypothetical protein
LRRGAFNRALFAVALALGGMQAARAAEAVQVARLEWGAGDPRFGGFSGLVVEDGGRRVTAVTDHGTLWSGDVARGPDHAPTGVDWMFAGQLLDNKGRPVADFRQDAEDLARGADGRLYVSFEHYARISGFDPPDLRPHVTHAWDRFRALWNNEGFEALAVLPDGDLVAVVETAVDGGYPTFRRTGALTWAAGPPIPAGEGGYAAAGADVGPDGRLYLLERRMTVLLSFATRVRRFAVTGDGWGPGDVVLETGSGALPNMEAISVWTGSDGALRLTLMSDNGFRAAPSVLAEFRLDP